MRNNGFIIENDLPEDNFNDNNHGGKPPKKRIKRSVRIVVNVVISLVLVLSLAGSALSYFVGFYDLAEENTTTDMSDVKPSINRNVTYFLIAGTDEKKELTDVLMVVCFDHGNNQANILQIPRDTFIGTDIDTCKVNAVYGQARRNGEASNINFLMRRINNYFGLPIDQYAVIPLSAFRKIVDAVGGVDVYIPEEMDGTDSETQETHYIEPGMQHLDGKLAEVFVRYRKGYTMGDLGRNSAQRNFYAAFFKALLNMSVGQMTTAAQSCYSDVKTSMSIGTLLSYAEEARKLDINNIGIYSVPGVSGMYSPAGEELSYYSADISAYVDMVNNHFMPYDEVGITADDIYLEQLHDDSEFRENYNKDAKLSDYSAEKSQTEESTIFYHGY